MIRVVVVDDQPLARAGIAMLLESREDIAVVAEAADGQEALTQARAQRPDVILMDVRMPGIDGVEATRTVINERLATESGQPVRIIILTAYHVDDAIYAALRAGASGFLLKDAAHTEIAAAIRAVAAGDAWLNPAVTRQLIDKFNARPEQHTASPDQMAQLTPREREVLIFLTQGLYTADIAGKLFISEFTAYVKSFDLQHPSWVVAGRIAGGYPTPPCHQRKAGGQTPPDFWGRPCARCSCLPSRHRPHWDSGCYRSSNVRHPVPVGIAVSPGVHCRRQVATRRRTAVDSSRSRIVRGCGGRCLTTQSAIDHHCPLRSAAWELPQSSA